MKKIILSLFFFGITTCASAATVYLKNGNRIDGTVISATSRDVKVHTPNGTQTISASDIQRIDYAQTPPVQPAAPSQPSEPIMPQSYPRRVASIHEQPGRQMFSVGFGVVGPVSRISFSEAGGGSSSNGNTGIILGAQYHYFLSSKWAAGLDLEFMNRSPNSTQNLLPASNTDVWGNTTLMLATMRYSLTDRGTVRPYVLAGLGTNRTSTMVEATPNDGFGWSDTLTNETRTLVDDSRWGFAHTARVGLDFVFQDPSMFTLEFGWTGISNGDYTATPAGKDVGINNVTGKLNVLNIAARWGWRF
jgi:outer membrane protein W